MWRRLNGPVPLETMEGQCGHYFKCDEEEIPTMAELFVEFVRNYKLMMSLRLGTGTKRRFCLCLNWYIIATSSTINMFVVVRNSPLCAAL